MVEAFEERSQALKRAQGLLSQFGSDTVEIRALLRAELAAYVDRTFDRVTIAGPKVPLTDRQAQNFALTLHELTTNALKHGALKDETGQLSITWEIVRDRRDRRERRRLWPLSLG